MAGLVRAVTFFGIIGAGIGASALLAPAAQSRPAAQQYTVTMANMAYGSLPANAKVGDTIIWVNRDTVPHTITARDHSFDVRVAPGQSGRMVLQKAGNFPFYCIFHTGMRGVLKVAA